MAEWRIDLIGARNARLKRWEARRRRLGTPHGCSFDLRTLRDRLVRPVHNLQVHPELPLVRELDQAVVAESNWKRP